MNHLKTTAVLIFCLIGIPTIGQDTGTPETKVPEQQLLRLRKTMSLITNYEQKVEVIHECSKVKTFLSFMFVSEYMDDGQFRQDAALAAVQIALPTPGKDDGLYGEYVKAGLTKAKKIISGPERRNLKQGIKTYLDEMPDEQGFVSIFNGTDFNGWQGLVEDPIAREKMDNEELAEKQAEANKLMLSNRMIQDGILVFTGSGYDNICTIKEYSDFEMIVDWRIHKKGDSGIYLRGSPQVQIWENLDAETGLLIGSGGLFNNKINQSTPLSVADNPIPDWNTFRIVMIGERVTVFLNGILVVDNVVMENYWDRNIPIFPAGPIELQAHGNDIAFRDIYVREIPGSE